MLFRASIVVFSVILALVASPARADIVLTVGTDTFVQDSGVQTLNVVARSDAADTPTGFAVDFQLTAGTFDTPPGTFGQAGNDRSRQPQSGHCLCWRRQLWQTKPS